MVHSMAVMHKQVPRKVILGIFHDLQTRFPSCCDRWYPIDFWRRLIYHIYDFGDGLELTDRQLGRQIENLGPVALSVEQGNVSGFHSRHVTKTIFRDRVNFPQFRKWSHDHDSIFCTDVGFTWWRFCAQPTSTTTVPL